MDVESFVTAFRQEVSDEAEPRLWSDSEIVGFLDDAQKQFCRLAYGISDSTSSITTVPYAAGDEYVVYDPRILRIRMARIASSYRPLVLRNFEDYMSSNYSGNFVGNPIGNYIGTYVGRYNDYGAFMPSPVLDMRTGNVTTLVTNMSQNALRLVYIPDTDDALTLTVYRMPLESLTESSMSSELEIDEQHHIHLLHWMKYRAYRKEDAETFDKSRSAENKLSFQAYCEQAKDEIARREHKVRVVAYGGY